MYSSRGRRQNKNERERGQECPVKASEPVELSTGVVYAIMKRERGRAGQQRMINPAVEMRCAGAMHVMDS